MKILRALLLAIASLALAGCALQQNLVLAEEAVDVFHEKYTAAALGEMYDAVSADIRKERSREEFAKAIAAIREQLGPVRGTNRTAFETMAGSGGAFVHIEYRTEFERGNATEEFIWEIADGKALLKGYTVTTQTLP